MSSPIILDASAAGKLFRQEAESNALHEWLQAELEAGSPVIVPGIFPFELRNIAAKSVLEGTFPTAKAAASAYAAVMDLVDIQGAEEPGVEISLAVRAKLSTYDASYLLLGARGRLVTYDLKLAKAARAELKRAPISPG